MLPHILSNIPQLLASEDWKCRHAALMAISSCGEGCHKLMATMLNQIVENIVPFTRYVLTALTYRVFLFVQLAFQILTC